MKRLGVLLVAVTSCIALGNVALYKASMHGPDGGGVVTSHRYLLEAGAGGHGVQLSEVGIDTAV